MIMFVEVRNDDNRFGFVTDHGRADDRFRAYAYASEAGLAHYAGEYATDGEAAAAVLGMSVLIRLPAEGRA